MNILLFHQSNQRWLKDILERVGENCLQDTSSELNGILQLSHTIFRPGLEGTEKKRSKN